MRADIAARSASLLASMDSAAIDIARLVGGDIDEAAERSVPLKRVGQPSDYADAILFLAVGARYMTGETILINGGSKL